MTALTFLKKAYRKVFPYKKKCNILLVQLANRNLGDLVIADNTCKMLEKATRKGRYSYNILRTHIKNLDTCQIEYADAVVFSGGGLVKFMAETFYELLWEFISKAQECNVPVFLNAVGVEGYDDKDERCQLLKKALNLPCVKGITVRDDLETLLEKYIENDEILIKEVFDPAVWCDETYGEISADKNSEIIGLGLAREGIFTDHGIERIDKEYLLEFWKETALKLEEQGYKWCVFTNGLDKDETFAKEFVSYIGYGEILIQPAKPHQLVENICKFKGVIATRMHSNIIAYSMGIPSVGLVWNEKLALWGKKIGFPERFVTADNLTAENAVNALLKALGEKQKKLSKKNRNAGFKEIKRFVKKQVSPLEREKLKLDYKKHMLATALGGMEFKYNNTNCLDSFENSLNDSYRNFEVDLRLTNDNKLVCVNGWNENTYKALGMSRVGEEAKSPLSYEEYLSSSYYANFTPCDFIKFLERLSLVSDRKIKLIADLGKPSEDDFQNMLSEFENNLNEYRDKLDNVKIYVRLQRKRDVLVFKEKKLNCEIIYFVAENKNDDKDYYQSVRNTLDYCKKQKIKMVSMSDKTYNEKICEILKEYGVKACIFTYTNTEKIINAIKNGAELVGSHYYGVKYLEKLTK